MLIQKCLRGFTVVELLIVIVVISILATLTTVAYNGVVERSQDAVIASTVESYAKAITTYRAKNGRWPLGDTAPSEPKSACLGSPASYATTYGYLYPGICGTLGGGSVNTTFNELMAPYIPNPPDLSFMKPMQFTPTQKYARGIFYSLGCLPNFCTVDTTPVSDQRVIIAHFVKAGKACAAGTLIPDRPLTGFTMCEYTLQPGKP